MTLEIKPGSDWWYGRWMRDGKRHFSRLNVRIAGIPPAKLSETGSAEFEESRKAAQAAYKDLVAKWGEQTRPEDLVQEIHRVKYGHRIGNITLSQLFKAWQEIPRKRTPKTQYVMWCRQTFERFHEFVQHDFPKVKEMSAVDKKVAEAFMRHEQGRKVSPKTYNAVLILLRGAFEHLREDAGMLANPFGKIVTKDRDTIHRKPFTPEELRAILDAVQDDALLRPLVVTGMCTAMRRGDSCLLTWESVDLANGFIRVKTSKTSESVEIPMYPLLRHELQALPAAGDGFVFPELARMYLDNPDGINWRLGKVFARAGFPDKANPVALATNPVGDAPKRGEVHVKRETGLHTANIRGFQSFRVSWITTALAAGVPLEIVQRVTGHKTVDVVMRHYFRPGREEFRRTLEKAMPQLLLEPGSGGSTQLAVSRLEPQRGPGELLAKALMALDAMTGKNWKAQRDGAAQLVRQAKGWVDGHILRDPKL